MLLSNLLSVPKGRNIDILIEKDKISDVSEHNNSLVAPQQVEFDDAIVFPGLINSHDHLDFNSFPQLGNRLYSNYVEWGEDIHRQNKDAINKVLKIPQELRIQWGVYKNLLNGITTVVNHGPKLTAVNEIITITQQSHSLHSVQLEKKWKYKLNIPSHRPIVIHIGEGTDEASHKEIDALIKWNLFNRELIGIHAVAMDENQAANFKAVVWCPDSNYFLLGRTAEMDKLKNRTKILFGTDSTVSSNWNLWEHLRLARQEKKVSDNELLDMLTVTPADIWNIPQGGKIEKDCFADIVVAKKKSGALSDGFFSLGPEDILMVIHKGNIRLFDGELHEQLSANGIQLQNFYKIDIKGKCKYIFGNVPQLISSIRRYYPEASFPVTC